MTKHCDGVYLCYLSGTVFSSHYFFQLCIQKKLHGMTRLLYKMKMIMKIRFINTMKDAELGSAEDLIRIPPLDMKLGGTRLITPL